MKKKIFLAKKNRVWGITFLMLFTSIMLILLTSACGAKKVAQNNTAPVGGIFCNGPNDPPHGDWGAPNKFDFKKVNISDDEVNVAFGLITDTHLDALTCNKSPAPCLSLGYSDWYNDSDKMKRTRKVIIDLNMDCHKSGAVGVDCLGIMHLGDMIHNFDNYPQQLLAFRQLYEYDYPGANAGTVYQNEECSPNNKMAYARRDDNNRFLRINLPVIPMLGNHDATNNSDHAKWGPGGYIIQRLTHANGLLSEYPHPPAESTSFAWRWGKYVFISLGLWAGFPGYNDATQTDMTRLTWLKEVLDSTVKENLGVLLFQHYGWDGFSKSPQCNGCPPWWTDDQRDMMLDVLCRRDIEPGNNDTCTPYNILGIFTGHNHHQRWICLDAQGNEIDCSNTANVVFENFSFMPSGEKDTTDSCNGCYGFSVIHLTGDKMEIHTKEKKLDSYWPVTVRQIKVGN